MTEEEVIALARQLSRAGQQVTPQQQPEPQPTEEGLLSSIGSTALSGIGAIGNFLDLATGASSLRDILTLNNPFDQFLSPFSAENRASGRDMLEFYGARENKETGMAGWLDDPLEGVLDLGGFILEMGLDPINLVLPGAGALKGATKGAGKAATKVAGKAAAKAGKQAAREGAEQVAKETGKAAAAGAAADVAEEVAKEVPQSFLNKWRDRGWVDNVTDPFWLGELGQRIDAPGKVAKAAKATYGKVPEGARKALKAAGTAAKVHARQLFDVPSGGKATKVGQDISRAQYFTRMVEDVWDRDLVSRYDSAVEGLYGRNPDMDVLDGMEVNFRSAIEGKPGSLDALPDEIKPFVDELTERLKSRIADDRAAGLLVNELEDELIGYAPRFLSDAIRDYRLKQYGQRAESSGLGNALSTLFHGQRSQLRKDGYTEAFNRLSADSVAHQMLDGIDGLDGTTTQKLFDQIGRERVSEIAVEAGLEEANAIDLLRGSIKDHAVGSELYEGRVKLVSERLKKLAGDDIYKDMKKVVTGADDIDRFAMRNVNSGKAEKLTGNELKGMESRYDYTPHEGGKHEFIHDPSIRGEVGEISDGMAEITLENAPPPPPLRLDDSVRNQAQEAEYLRQNTDFRIRSLNKLKIGELKELAKGLGIKGFQRFTNKNRRELSQLIQDAEVDDRLLQGLVALDEVTPDSVRGLVETTSRIKDPTEYLVGDEVVELGRKVGKPETMRRLVRQLGGLSPESFKMDYSWKEDMIESGLPISIFQHVEGGAGNRALDGLAQELASTGLWTPRDVDGNLADQLLDALKNNELSVEGQHLADVHNAIDADNARIMEEGQPLVQSMDLDAAQVRGYERVAELVGARKGSTNEKTVENIIKVVNETAVKNNPLQYLKVGKQKVPVDSISAVQPRRIYIDLKNPARILTHEYLDRFDELARHLVDHPEEMDADGIFTNRPVWDFAASMRKKNFARASATAIKDAMVNGVGDFLKTSEEALAAGWREKSHGIRGGARTLGGLLSDKNIGGKVDVNGLLDSIINENPERFITKKAEAMVQKRIAEGMDPDAADNLRRSIAQQEMMDAVESGEEAFFEYQRELREMASGLEIEPALFEDLKESFDFGSSEELFGGAKSGWKTAFRSATALFKAGVLTAPARYTRDVVSGQIANMYNDMYSFEAAKAAWGVLHGRGSEYLLQIPEVQRYMEANGLEGVEGAVEAIQNMYRSHRGHARHLRTDIDDITDVATEAGQAGRAKQFGESVESKAGIGGTGDSFLDEILSDAGIMWDAAKSGTWNPLDVIGFMGRTSSEFKPVKAGDLMGKMSDDLNRMVGFIRRMEKGDDAATAMEKVNRVQVNYDPSTFTPTEQMFKRIFPFYSFMSRQGAYVTNELLTSPNGRLGNIIRAIRHSEDEKEHLPAHVKAGFAMPIGESADGGENYLTGLGLMFEDTLNLAPTGGSSEFFRDIISKTNPFIKAPIEWGLGRSSFQGGPLGGRDLYDMDPTLGRIFTQLGIQSPLPNQQAAPAFGSRSLEFALSNSPVSRILSTTRTMLDDRKSIAQRAMQTLTGLRITTVSPEQKRRGARDTIDAMLKEMGVRPFTTFQPSKEWVEQLPEGEEKRSIQAINELKKLWERERRAKKKAEQN